MNHPAATPGQPSDVPYVCAVCGRHLSQILLPGVRPEDSWIHVDWDPELVDHPAIAVPYGTVPSRGRCDFCGEDDPTHLLETPEVHIAGVRHDNSTEVLGGMDTTWALCRICLRLVEQGRWNDLTRRCLASMRELGGPPMTPALEDSVRQLHRVIRRTMKGPPQPIPKPGA